jgi:trans-aconitate methyltransferase
VLDVEIGQILSKGNGTLHGIDSSPAMIAAAQKSVASAGLGNTCTFQRKSPLPHPPLKLESSTDLTHPPVLDATDLVNTASLQTGSFTKAFSNAALHWILRPPTTRAAVFHGVRNALCPGATFAFETGGFGNVSEIRAALLSAVGRRVGLARAEEADPWFFPDEEWIRHMMEETVGGWKVERVEREWRPTRADQGGVEGWVRLMASKFFEVIEDEREREECVREVVDVLEVVCRQPEGGWVFGYVRLRVLARKI